MTDVYIPTDDGQWVSENFARLAEIINDYDQWLELRWIPPDKRSREDKEPYVIVDSRTNTAVFYASERDTPQEILARLFRGDNKNGDFLQNLEAFNAAQKAFELKAELEKREEIVDYIAWLVKSPQNWVTADGKKFDDQRRVIGSAKDRKIL